MPLKIKLPANEMLMLNGAVLENAGESTILILHNQVDILRRKEIMQQEEADSPARLVYYTIQCAYMFENDRPKFLEAVKQHMNDYLDAAASAEPIIDEIANLLSSERYYHALRKTLELIAHEEERFAAIASGGDAPSSAEALDTPDKPEAKSAEAKTEAKEK